MFAVIKTGGKQYKVAAKDVVCVEKIDGVNAGETISFDTVLMVGEGEAVTVGLPKIAGAVVLLGTGWAFCCRPRIKS